MTEVSISIEAFTLMAFRNSAFTEESNFRCDASAFWQEFTLSMSNRELAIVSSPLM